MVIRDLHPLRSVIGPDETDPVLVVDPDAVLPLPVLAERLQMVPWWDSQGGQGDCGVQLVELTLRDAPQGFRTGSPCRFGPAPVEDVFRALLIERPNRRGSAAGCEWGL